MFSERHDTIWSNILLACTSSRYDSIRFLTDHSPYNPAITKIFWNPDFGMGGSLDNLLLKRARATKNQIYAGSVYAIVPLYVTSICMEECLYCNYRAGNKRIEVERIRLSDTELIAEARHLIEEKGMRVLELVYATDPLNRADAMCRHVELLQRVLDEYGGGSVGINAEALEVDEYRRLVDAGLAFAVLWQETYDRRRYNEIHLGTTKKTNFEYRLDAYERMIMGGIRHIGMGVLSGLSDWKMDWTMLIQHEDYLRREYGMGASILGIPRLKVAAGAVLQESSFTPNSQEFLAAVAVHNIYSPNAMPFVNTREDWELCVNLSKGGGCLFTFNCSTIPGGYSLGHKGYQFPTHSYDAVEYVRRLEGGDSKVVFNWDLDQLCADVKQPSRNVSKYSELSQVATAR